MSGEVSLAECLKNSEYGFLSDQHALVLFEGDAAALEEQIQELTTRKIAVAMKLRRQPGRRVIVLKSKWDEVMSGEDSYKQFCRQAVLAFAADDASLAVEAGSVVRVH